MLRWTLLARQMLCGMVLICLLIGGCASAGRRPTVQVQLQSLYPHGQSRQTILAAAKHPPRETVSLLDNQPREGIVAYHLRQIKAASAGEPVKYDVFSRMTASADAIPSIPNPMAVSLYDDYVYYDQNDRCIWAGPLKVD